MNSDDSESKRKMDSGWPTSGLETVPSCPVCNSGKRKRLYGDLTDRVFFCAPGKWTMFVCGSCGSAYLDPRPTVESIDLAYKAYFTHKPNKLTDGDGLRGFRRVRRALANGYRNWRFGLNMRPENRLGVLAAAVMPAYREVLEAEMRYLPRHTRQGRVLDVGCGNGTFLCLARAAGWQVAGVDPDPNAVAVCRAAGLEVREGGVEVFLDEANTFDAVTLGHVIEHAHDPRLLLRHCMNLLRPGGQLYVDTPNLHSLGHKRFGQYWLDLDPPRHLVVFNWDSLERLVRDIGFVDIRRRPRRAVYPGRSQASRAIREGRDPFSNLHPNLSDYLVGWCAGLLVRMNYRKSEFVTITAKKPQ